VPSVLVRGWLERLVRRAAVMAAAVLFALPVLLGPATPVAVALLADAVTAHHCACGMKAGRCGCPECEESARRLDGPTGPVVRRFSCDDPRFVQGALPPMLLPPGLAAPRASAVSTAFDANEERAPAGEDAPPPTPPPRAGA
jgi:hypothetical protein